MLAESRREIDVLTAAAGAERDTALAALKVRSNSTGLCPPITVTTGSQGQLFHGPLLSTFIQYRT